MNHLPCICYNVCFKIGFLRKSFIAIFKDSHGLSALYGFTCVFQIISKNKFSVTSRTSMVFIPVWVNTCLFKLLCLVNESVKKRLMLVFSSQNCLHDEQNYEMIYFS